MRVAIATSPSVWVVLQVSQTVVPQLRLPEWTTALLVWIGVVVQLIFADAVDLPLGDVDQDPRMQAAARQMKARFATQKAELDRMQKPGMDAVAAVIRTQ